MYLSREFHDLHTGDSFSFEKEGAPMKVSDGDYIDYWGNRLVLYPGYDGQLHAHAADHERVWLIISD